MYNEQISTIATVIIFSKLIDDRVFTRREFENLKGEVMSAMPRPLAPCSFDTMSGYFNVHHSEEYRVIEVRGNRWEKVNLTEAEYAVIPSKVRDLLDIDIQTRVRYHYQFSQSKIEETKNALKTLALM